MSRTDTFDAIDHMEDAAQPAAAVRLGRGARGMRGTVIRVGVEAGAPDSVAAVDLERRLLEIGFVEGAQVEILHEGLIGRDPIAIRLDDMRVALRRREADAILVSVARGRTPGLDEGR